MVKEKELILILIQVAEIIRVARIAFDLAKKRSNKVTSCEKSNVMEAGSTLERRGTRHYMTKNIRT